MNEYNEKPVRSGKHAPILQKSKVRRECCCIKEYNKLKNNLKTLQAISQTCPEKQKSNKLKKVESEFFHNSKLQENKKKTWFDVLRESPKKETQKQILTNEPSEKYSRILNHAHLFKNIDPQGLTLLLDDEQFLKKLIQMNEVIQSYIRKNAKNHRDISITDDDKFRSYLGLKRQEESEEQKEKQNLQAKALVKLLENMQSVSVNTEVQKETLDNLTRLIIQLRDENKMLDKLKKVRVDLELKLSSLSTENVFLKKQLHAAEIDRDKANHLLDVKETEIDQLKKHITAIKRKIASKIDSGIRYDLLDASLELNNLNETIASLPSNNNSFEAPIRPASSSPTEEIMQKWKIRNSAGRPEDDSGIQSNPRETCDSPSDDDKLDVTQKHEVLSNLKNNVKKTLEGFQLDMKFNDVSLNLSDATYKISSSSAV